MKIFTLRNILSLVLVCGSFTAHAFGTNYHSIDQCRDMMYVYSKKAVQKNLSQLAKWFNSFSLENEGSYTCLNNDCKFVHIGACSLVEPNDEISRKLWAIMQSKLDQQLQQLGSGKDSNMGDKAKVQCVTDTAFHIDFSTCK